MDKDELIQGKIDDPINVSYNAYKAQHAAEATNDVVTEARAHIARLKADMRGVDTGCTNSYDTSLLGSLCAEIERLRARVAELEAEADFDPNSIVFPPAKPECKICGDDPARFGDCGCVCQVQQNQYAAGVRYGWGRAIEILQATKPSETLPAHERVTIQAKGRVEINAQKAGKLIEVCGSRYDDVKDLYAAMEAAING